MKIIFLTLPCCVYSSPYPLPLTIPPYYSSEASPLAIAYNLSIQLLWCCVWSSSICPSCLPCWTRSELLPPLPVIVPVNLTTSRLSPEKSRKSRKNNLSLSRLNYRLRLSWKLVPDWISPLFFTLFIFLFVVFCLCCAIKTFNNNNNNNNPLPPPPDTFRKYPTTRIKRTVLFQDRTRFEEGRVRKISASKRDEYRSC